MCSVYVPEQDKTINIASEHLEPVPPEKGDRVWYYKIQFIWKLNKFINQSCHYFSPNFND